MIGQRGCNFRRCPLVRSLRRPVESRGNLEVGRFAADGQMSRSLVRIHENRSEPLVKPSPLLRRGLGVHGRGEQRVGKADPAVIQLDDPGVGCLRKELRSELLRPQGCVHDLDSRVRKRGDDEQCPAGAPRESAEPISKKISQVVRDGQRIAGRQRPALVEKCSSELEREERVATGRAVKFDELWAQEALPKALA